MLFNDPKFFREDMLKGYVAAFPDYVTEVPGGVARASELPEGKVAVINGGGCGHYPAFCGIIGEGFMDATVVGNVFTSPSVEDVYNVARSVENGSGVFIVGGNYAGDKMNFNLARDRLISEGVDARTFYITDDMVSAPAEEWEKRRGNVGTFTVFTAAGAAAAQGKTFDEIMAVTREANDRTRTMSIGFKGCTLPGAEGPLFSVPAGRMEVGQGIHGEAGVYEADLCGAAEIARILVERVLSEKPADAGDRIAVILDGLGSTKYEELFVVWKTVSELLKEAGFVLVQPLVGELVTSLDMSGIALSVTYLTETLEECWLYPADTASFRRGQVTGAVRAPRRNRADVRTEKAAETAPVSEASRAMGAEAVEGLKRALAEIQAKEEQLAELDGIAGDGDHGRGMVKGLTYAAEEAARASEAGAGLSAVLTAAGKAWGAKAGGTSGVLWGEALQAAAKTLDGADELSLFQLAGAFRSALGRMQELGGAKAGDKTMLDALIPCTECLERAANEGKTWRVAVPEAVRAAEQAARDTAGLMAKVGRARPQAQRSLGIPDPGAVSLAMCLRAAFDVKD